MKNRESFSHTFLIERDNRGRFHLEWMANSIVKWTIWLEEVLAANDRSLSFIIYACHPNYPPTKWGIKLWRNSGSIIVRIITTLLLYISKFDYGNAKSHGVCKLYASFNCAFETLHANCLISEIIHSEFYLIFNEWMKICRGWIITLESYCIF